MDGRDALPRSASARATRPYQGTVGTCGQRPPSEVLPDHVQGQGPARRGTQAMADSGHYVAGDLEVALSYGGLNRISGGDSSTSDPRTHLNCRGNDT